jgi:hypothetical protein
MRLSFHHRDQGHELGSVELVNGIAVPSNDYAKRKMQIVLADGYSHIKPEHGEHFIRALAEHLSRSSGVVAKLS